MNGVDNRDAVTHFERSMSSRLRLLEFTLAGGSKEPSLAEPARGVMA
jgi:hypothetical protein